MSISRSTRTCILIRMGPPLQSSTGHLQWFGPSMRLANNDDPRWSFYYKGWVDALPTWQTLYASGQGDARYEHAQKAIDKYRALGVSGITRGYQNYSGTLLANGTLPLTDQQLDSIAGVEFQSFVNPDFLDLTSDYGATPAQWVPSG